jgi:hypothetical protein
MDKLTNPVSSTFDDDLYAFVKAAAANDDTDVSGYIRAAISVLRDRELNKYKMMHSVFESQICLK